MKEDDYTLSMRISLRGQTPGEAPRTVLLHRLTNTAKAALRRHLRYPNRLSVYCEPCERWSRVDAPPVVWLCPKCQRWYRAEVIIYAEVTDE